MYKYSPLKIIHNDLDIEPIRQHMQSGQCILNTEVKHDVRLARMADVINEFKITITWVIRILNEKRQIYGSYITEQSFLLSYQGDDDAAMKIKHMFESSQSNSKNSFAAYTKSQSIEILLFHYESIQDDFLNDIVSSIRWDLLGQ